MNFLNSKKNRKNNVDLSFNSIEASERLSEEILYEKVAEELERNEKRKGLWLKAKSQSGGDDNVAESIYIELRKQSLVDEIILTAKRDTEFNNEVSEQECIDMLEDLGYKFKKDKQYFYAMGIDNPESQNPMNTALYSAETLKDLCDWAAKNPFPNQTISTESVFVRRDILFDLADKKGYFAEYKKGKFIISAYKKRPPGAIIEEVCSVDNLDEFEDWITNAKDMV